LEPDIIGITETWLNDKVNGAEVVIEGYDLFRCDRLGMRGGGVLLYIKD